MLTIDIDPPVRTLSGSSEGSCEPSEKCNRRVPLSFSTKEDEVPDFVRIDTVESKIVFQEQFTNYMGGPVSKVSAGRRGEGSEISKSCGCFSYLTPKGPPLSTYQV